MRVLCIFFSFLLLPSLLFGQYQHLHRNSDIHEFMIQQSIDKNREFHSSLQYFYSKDAFDQAITSYRNQDKVQKFLAGKILKKYPEFWIDITPNDSMNHVYVDTTNTFYTLNPGENPFQEITSPSDPVLKYFYKNRTWLFSVNNGGLILNINPILNFGIGNDFSQEEYVFQNTRGLEISGSIDEKVYFYTNILENQAAFPSYIKNFVQEFKSLPGQGLYKNYNSVIFGSNAGYDYLNAQAYFGGKITKHIGGEFGHGRNFIGNGQRSLLLSDFSNNNLYLKFNTRIWKIHYQNLFSQLIPGSLRDYPGLQVIPRKYSATHYLSFKHKGFEIGLYESTVFSREDGFELHYLNPVILYRLVEHDLRSSDNVLVGMNINYSFANKFIVYSQLLLDEFKLNELILQENGPGWWANKYGIQAGVRYFDAFGMNNLNLLFEYNRVRPYTYGHRTIANYSHYNMPIAHPLGANFEELIAGINYYLTPKLSFQSNNFLMLQGLDIDTLHYGSNIIKPNSNRIMDYNNQMLQGAKSTTILSNNRLSYEIFMNTFVDLNLVYRSQTSEIEDLNFKNILLSLGLRMNFWEPDINI